jgi:hypothetical protein
VVVVRRYVHERIPVWIFDGCFPIDLNKIREVSMCVSAQLLYESAQMQFGLV